MPELRLVVDNAERIYYPDMTRKELEGYCDIHCETQRALFSYTMIAQMVEYAGCPEGFSRPEKWMENPDWFLSVHEPMKTLVELSKERHKGK